MCPRRRWPRWKPCIVNATPGSRRSISMSILVRDHSFRWGYTWTKVFLQSTGLLERPAAGCSSAQAAAPSAAGMMLRQDASKHEWCADSPSVTSW
jgi:hypothetical protein